MSDTIDPVIVRFLALDVRGQVVRARNVHVTELFESLESDYAAGRLRAVVLNYRTFVLHAINACLIGSIPDHKILVGQQTPSGSDKEKIEKYLGEKDELLGLLGGRMHGVHPCPDEPELVELAKTLMKAAHLLKGHVDDLDKGLNRWFNEMVASGITPSRHKVTRKERKIRGK